MKNVYKATRPAWASLHGLEPYAVALAGVLIVALSPTGRKAYDEVLGIPPSTVATLSPSSPTEGTALDEHQREMRRAHTRADLGWEVLLVLVPIGCWFGFVWAYRRLTVDCYPSAFVYCFHVPERYNASHCRKVVGYLEVSAERREGEIVVEGTSMDWDGGYPVPNTDMSYRSTHTYGTKKDGEIICNIRFEIDKEDQSKRDSERGLLQFQLIRSTDQGKQVDQYAGSMRSARSTSNDPEIDNAVRCKGYAEKLSRPINGAIEGTLENKGAHLFSELDSLLRRDTHAPKLWKHTEKDKLKFDLKNRFGLIVPSPQSVLLDGRVATFIDAALNKMFMHPGTSQAAIENFKKTARQLARQDEEFPTKNFEDDIKRMLSDRFEGDRRHPDPVREAKATYERISSYADGNSLLDVECANGLVSELLQARLPKSRIQHFPFARYSEGHALPGGEKEYDTVLLLNVLHHADDPEQLFDTAWEKTAKRIIIIEPVVGVREDPRCLEGESAKFAKLDQPQQVAYAAFVDWFYSRILHHIPVGYNFATPEKWESIFRKRNVDFVTNDYICQDIELEPMPHALFVLDKKQSVPHEVPEVAA